MITLNEKNINNVIKKLRNNLKNNSKNNIDGVLIREWWRTDKIDRNKYRGRGRPRHFDYIYEHYREVFKGLLNK